MPDDARNVVASAIGWLIVGVAAFWVLSLVLGAIGFVLRSLVWLVVLGLLVAAYFKIKDPPDV